MNIFFTKKTFSDRNFFIFILLYSIVMPTFDSLYGNLGVAIVNFPIIGFGFIWVLKKKLIFKFQSDYSKKFFLFFLFSFLSFFIWFFVSSSIGYTLGSVSPNSRDLYEVYRPLLYFLSFAIGFYSFKSLFEAEKTIPKVYLTYFIIVAVIGFLQFFRVSDGFSLLYTKLHNISSFRVAAPFPNPYDFAFILSFFVIYFLNCAINVKKRYYFLAFLSLVLFILPQSRSVAAGFMVGFFAFMPAVYLLLTVLMGKVTRNFLIYFLLYLLILLIFLISIPFLINEFPYLTGQFVKLVESGSIGNSANIRYEQFLFALNKSENILIFIFGNGPAKSEMQYVESIYNYFFYRYGLVGFLLYFVFPLAMLLYMSFKSLLKLDRKSYLFSFLLSIAIWSMTIPFMVIGNNFTEQVRISFFYYSLIGVVSTVYLMTQSNRKAGSTS